MILVTNPRTGERENFADDVAFVRWLRSAPQTGDLLRVASLAPAQGSPDRTPFPPVGWPCGGADRGEMA